MCYGKTAIVNSFCYSNNGYIKKIGPEEVSLAAILGDIATRASFLAAIVRSPDEIRVVQSS